MANEEKTGLDIVIAERTYHLSVDEKSKERILKVANDINKMIVRNSTSYAHRDERDLLAMVALQYAVTAAKYEEEKTFKDKYLENKLTEISDLLSSEIVS